MNTTNYIRIFRGDDSDALGYQTIVGTIKTDLDLTGCKAVFRFLGFYAEFDPIPEDKKLTIVIPAQASRGFPPGVGYASLKVFDSLGKIRTFTNRIPVIVDTMTPSCAGGEFEVSFSPFPELEPLKIFIGPNADDFDQYTGFLSKIIDRASLAKYGLVVLADAMSEDGGVSGKAASPLAVKAAYDAIITELTNNYYTAAQTDEAIDRVAAYYITYDAAGNPFPTYTSLANAQTVYSGGAVRVPTRNDYCVVLADETHQGAEYRYIYAVAEGETTGSWQPQFPVGGVMTVDQTVTKNSPNPVSSGGIWSAIWGTASTAFSSLYDWCVSQLADKLDKSGGTITLPYDDDVKSHLIIKDSKHAPAVDIASNDDDDNYEITISRYADVILNFDCLYDNDLGLGTSLSDKLSGKANRASNPTAGNLAALDAQGNPTDSTIPAANVAVKGDIPYDLAAVSNNTLADRTVNTATVNAATYAPSFPTETNGKSCDFYLALTSDAAGTMSATGKTFKNAKGEAADMAYAANATTVFHFTQTAANTYLVQGGNNGGGSIDPAVLNAKLDSTSAAPAFDSTATYAVDEHVTYNGKLYRCTTAVTTAGAWDASNWTADTMTDPDAVLDITAQNQLRVVAKDGTLLWAQGYDLASTSSATLACDAANNFTFAAISAFSDAATYDVDDRVTYGGKTYKCTTAVETAGAWTGNANWTEDPVMQAFALPTAPTGKVGDFGLDIDNSANTGAATMTLTGLDTAFSVVVPKGASLNDMLAIAAGELAQFYVTLTTFRVNNLPTWHIVKQVVENGGAQS